MYYLTSLSIDFLWLKSLQDVFSWILFMLAKVDSKSLLSSFLCLFSAYGLLHKLL